MNNLQRANLNGTFNAIKRESNFDAACIGYGLIKTAFCSFPDGTPQDEYTEKVLECFEAIKGYKEEYFAHARKVLMSDAIFWLLKLRTHYEEIAIAENVARANELLDEQPSANPVAVFDWQDDSRYYTRA